MRSPSLDVPSSSLRLLAFLALASAVVSWPGRLENGLVCPALHVTHRSASNGNLAQKMNATGVVSMVLLKDGEKVNCFQPGQNYEGMQYAALLFVQQCRPSAHACLIV